MTEDREGRADHPTVCVACGGPIGRKPRRDSTRPPDVCATCWRRTRPWERNPGFRERAQERRQDERRQLRVAGLCTVCRQPFEGGADRCPSCRARRQEAERAAGKALVEAGTCRRCRERPAAPGRTRCETCLAEARADSARRRARKAGRTGTLAESCRECGRPMGRNPRRGSGRPLDVCTPCWSRRSEEERQEARRVARRRDRQRTRYRERLATDPEFAEGKRAYMRDYMRERRERQREENAGAGG